jgi:hypothetical protein
LPVNEKPSTLSGPGRWKFILPLALVLGLALAGLITRRTVSHVVNPAPVSALAEINRTNLFRLQDHWCQNGSTNLFTGIMVGTYPSGAAQFRSAVSNGLLNGLSEGWYTNGGLQVQEYYRSNLSDGLRTLWYPNGHKLSEVSVGMGRMNGTYRRLYEDGSLAEEIPMSDGRIDGNGRAFYKSGFVKAEVRYQAGKVVRQDNWKDGERKGI